MSRYPDNWKAISDQIKAEAKGQCQRCGWVCDGSSRDRVLQVHHWDMKPENNTRSNLVALCPRCHLELHSRGRGNVSEGQMGLLGEDINLLNDESEHSVLMYEIYNDWFTSANQ